MYQLQVRLDHNMPFSNLSKSFPEAIISRWCNLQVDVLEIEAPRDTVKKIKDSMDEILQNLSAKPIFIAEYQQGLEIVVKCRCAMENSSVSVVEASDCVPVMPVVYKKGYEYMKIIAFDRKHIQDVLNNLISVSKVKVQEMGNIPGHTARSAITISLDSIFGNLSDKQLQAIVQALEMGYYMLPKRAVKVDRMAEVMGVSRSTFEEHLRKAETKLLQALRPYARIAYISRSEG